MPFKNGNIVPTATRWTDEMIQFLKDNFFKLTNKQLATALNLRLTVTRNKCSELGLKRMELEYWSKEMVQYLKDHYQSQGDVDIMNYFKKHFPKSKGWKRSAFSKKRKQLNLYRSEKELELIVKKNCKKGGPSYTIDKNSSSINMHPVWVAQQIAWRNPELQKEILKHTDIINAKKELIKLNRSIKQIQNGK